MSCVRLTVNALEAEDHLVLAGVTDEGVLVDEDQCRRLFDLPGIRGETADLPLAAETAINRVLTRRRQELVDQMASRDGTWFDQEMEKLDRWAEDRRTTLRTPNRRGRRRSASK